MISDRLLHIFLIHLHRRKVNSFRVWTAAGLCGQMKQSLYLE